MLYVITLVLFMPLHFFSHAFILFYAITFMHSYSYILFYSCIYTLLCDCVHAFILFMRASFYAYAFIHDFICIDELHQSAINRTVKTLRVSLSRIPPSTLLIYLTFHLQCLLFHYTYSISL